MLSADKLLDNRYRIESHLAQGGMGIVYKGVDTQTGAVVVLKQNICFDETFKKALKHEASFLARLEHPALPRFHHFIDGPDGQFLVLDFVDGPDLADLLEQQGEPFAWLDVANWGEQLLDVLDYLHTQPEPVIHRDIKPKNLKLNSKGKVSLLDFGLAKGTISHASFATSIPGYTLTYAPPEQIRGDGTDARSDLYSLAATLYDLATATHPTDSLHRLTAVTVRKPDPLLPAHIVIPSIPLSLSNFLQRAMSLDREQRFESAHAMLQVMRSLRADHTISVPIDNSIEEWPALCNPNNLPAQTTVLIGREREIVNVRRLLRTPEIRLVTLTGTGGIGKTRLGLQVAFDILDYFVDGVYFVSLASVMESTLVLPTISQVLSIEDDEKSQEESLKAFLQNKKLCLVLDNFEQVMKAAHLVARLLASCPQLKILVTSRERLNLLGEYEYPLPPLTLPDLKNLPPLDDITHNPAMNLFVQRAQAVKPDFTLQADSLQAVAEICFRLDGLPLAIELAAARIKLFSPQAILTRLDDQFKLLRGGPRDLPARHQTLEASLDWSYNLLSDDEKTLFRRFSVFQGTGRCESIEAVCNQANEPKLPPLQTETIDCLASLVDKSLLGQADGDDGEPQFQLLTVIRQYGQEQLRRSGELDMMQQQYAAYFLNLVVETPANLDQAKRMEQLDNEYDNLMGVISWSMQSPQRTETALKIFAASPAFWYLRGHVNEARILLTELLQKIVEKDSPAYSDAVYTAAYLARRQGDLEKAKMYNEESLAIGRKIGNKMLIAQAINGLGSIAIETGAYENAQVYYTEGLALYQELNDKRGLAVIYNNLGRLAGIREEHDQELLYLEECLGFLQETGSKIQVAYALGNVGLAYLNVKNLTMASEYFQRALSIHEEVKNRPGVAEAYRQLGHLAFDQQNYEAALHYYSESLKILKEYDSQVEMSEVLRWMAYLAVQEGHLEIAAVILAGEETLRNIIKIPSSWLDQPHHDNYLATLRAQLNADTLASSWKRGTAMSANQVTDFALAFANEMCATYQNESAQMR